jgi:hypothetical protein
MRPWYPTVELLSECKVPRRLEWSSHGLESPEASLDTLTGHAEGETASDAAGSKEAVEEDRPLDSLDPLELEADDHSYEAAAAEAQPSWVEVGAFDSPSPLPDFGVLVAEAVVIVKYLAIKYKGLERV